MSRGRDRSYVCGITTKVVISLPDEVLAAARQAVAEGRANSLSGQSMAFERPTPGDQVGLWRHDVDELWQVNAEQAGGVGENQ